eukprot:TRINITY_DN4303_c0_g1_i1.p1 TRINITY_DN4303_c0_g1~~TRINITY_DN4303_c0_g1_i1.p1  ORF type:complete len:289 (+),score=80.20 TRINITY_DN4303_c0_g1_i1:99-965(+)
MGNTTCAGDSDTPPTFAGRQMARVVLCRPGPYLEGFVPWSAVQQDPPGEGVVGLVTSDCVVFDEFEGQATESMSVGDRCFLLFGEHERGAAGLRFGLGDRVQCAVNTHQRVAWAPGTVVGLWYHEAAWAKLAPYQVRLDGHPVKYIFSPHDDKHLIREHDDRERVCGVMPFGPQPGDELRVDSTVVFTGGGRFAGDTQVLDDWCLKVGGIGIVTRYHGRRRPPGTWPVEVSFSRTGKLEDCLTPEHGVPLALAAFDVRLVTKEDLCDSLAGGGDSCGSAALSPRKASF